MSFANILTILLLIMKAQQTLVYQMDVSEYCKRKVLPSIFLAKNSVDTSSFVMQLTQIELPYSCTISVRTESGNSILMVIEQFPLKGVKKRCESNKPELLIHEMGETFSGYWGHFWKNIFDYKPTASKIYTLGTTQKILPKIVASTSRYTPPTTPKPPKPALKFEDSEEDDFIRVEVPLLNVSGKFVANGKENGSGEDEEEMFDLEYNVTPKSGVDYSTSVIPIVQFSIKSRPGWRKEDDDEPRFDLDIVEKYTPDHRLTMPRFISTTRLKFRKYYPRTTTKRRHLYFRKNSTKRKLQTLRLTAHKYTGYNFPTTKAMKSLQNFSKQYSWKTIKELINKANLTASLRKEGNKKMSDKINNILKEISDMKHNSSIYLKPNLSDFSKSTLSTTVQSNTFSITKVNTTQTISTKRKDGNQVTSTLSQLINQTSTSAGYSPLKKHDSVSNIINENYYIKELNTSSIVFNETENKTEPTQMPDKYLVDHESWENVVQSAPDMAVLLNKTKGGMNKHDIVNKNETALKRLKRKKREIHAIDIENARPHNVTTPPTLMTYPSSFGVADMQEFAQLIEVRDNEIYGRESQLFQRQFLGPIIYNICDAATKQRHVHLFNTSRIVIAINNFTNFAGLTMILTTARALVAGEIKCPVSNIECQVAGARVCIDSMTACDGVPNCGSQDIYDEDQSLCGVSEGLQHNVYVAAFTFLAVLLTLLYTVHYWLRRCVPKVADAFFIYTDGTENILYLQPKMRSPHDHGDQSSKLYHSSILDEHVVIMPEEIQNNRFKRFIRILCCGLTLRKKANEKSSSETEKDNNFDKKIHYSYTQLQIQNMMRNAKMSIESDSLEVMKIKKIDVAPPTIPVLKSIDSILTLEEPLPEDYKDELGMLKFLKATRKPSLNSQSKAVQLETKPRHSISMDNSIEMEIKNIEYNRPRLEEAGPSGVKPKNQKEQLAEPGPSGIQITEKNVGKSTLKHLRFDNNITMIPESILEIDEDEEEIDDHPKPTHRQSTFLDNVMGKPKFFGANENDNEPNWLKEHKRFWGGTGKAKKQTRTKNT